MNGNRMIFRVFVVLLRMYFTSLTEMYQFRQENVAILYTVYVSIIANVTVLCRKKVL